MGGDNVNEVNEVKFQYLQKSLDKTSVDLDKLKGEIKDFELSITKAITSLQTKLTIYVALASIGTGYAMKIIF